MARIWYISEGFPSLVSSDISAADLAHANFCQVSVLSKKDRLLKLCKEIGCLFFKSFVFYGIPQSKSREIEKKCFWYHIFWSGKLLYAWQSQNIGLCILKDPYHFGKKGSLRSCSELPELSVIFSRPIMWLVRVFLLTTNTIWIVVLLVKYMSVFY